MWWAGRLGRAPLHAFACTAGKRVPVLAGPGGVGKSTLLATELEAGGQAVSDNLCVSDGTTVWGLVEPMRIEGGRGRRMPYGRREAILEGRTEALAPDSVVVVRRGEGPKPVFRTSSPEEACRSLITGTYIAGELRRFWGLAATLSAGTGIGPAHPPVGAVASTLARSLPCYELILGRVRGTRLAEVLGDREVTTWT
jgi:hypothetical protein